MDTWKHKLKNNRYIDISHYKYVNILKQKWEKVFSFPCGFPADKRQNFKISKAFSKGQFIGSGSRKNEIFLFYLLLQCPDSNLRAHRDPSMKCERLKNTWERSGDQKAATRSGESSQGRSLLRSPRGKGNSEVMPHKVQH